MSARHAQRAASAPAQRRARSRAFGMDERARSRPKPISQVCAVQQMADSLQGLHTGWDVLYTVIGSSCAWLQWACNSACCVRWMCTP